MLHLFEQNQDLFTSWFVIRYERESDSYLLQIGAILQDGSRLELRDYLFIDGNRKYAYQWMEKDSTLRQRSLDRHNHITAPYPFSGARSS